MAAPFVVTLALLASACGLFKDLPPVATVTAPDANIVVNGGFESGGDPWTSLKQDTWSDYQIADGVAHTGTKSLHLQLQGDAAATGTHIVGAMQEVKAPLFPEFASGFYRVDAWQPAATFQYMQFVVIVRGGDFGDDIALHEIRFPIAGIDHEPFMLSNAHFVFLGREKPEMKKWTYFSYPVKRAFEREWGKAPTRWDSIQFFVETRYDGKTTDQGETSADVYIDDVYLGPQISNPNRPGK